MNKSKEIREWINLAVTIIGPAVLAWLIWSMDSKLDNQRLSIEAKANERFVAKEAYESDRTETNRRLDIISSDLSTIKIDIATMKGRDSAARHNPN